MNTNVIFLLIILVFIVGLIASSSSQKMKKDLVKVQANLYSKVWIIMYILPSLLNLYKWNIANFSQVNEALMTNTNNFFTKKTNLKNLHNYIDQSQKDIDFLSQMLNKNFDQKESFQVLYESISFLEKLSPTYHTLRKIWLIATFWLFWVMEKKNGWNKIKIIS